MTDDPFAADRAGPTSRQLREFAALWLVFFGGTGAWRAATEGLTAWAVAALVVAPCGAVGLVWPGLLRPVFVGWMFAVRPVAWLVQNAVLAVLYFGVFVPVGWVHRLLGRDALVLRRPPPGASLWAPLEPPGDPQSYTRQS